VIQPRERRKSHANVELHPKMMKSVMSCSMVPLLIATLSACGSDAVSSGRSPVATTTTRTTTPPGGDGSPGTCSEALRRLLKMNVPAALPFGDYCDYQGSRVVLAVFASSSGLEQQLSEYGGPPVWSVAADRWVASAAHDAAVPGWACNERDMAAAFASEFHGALRWFGC
jgi:hypothetical protein